MNTTNVSCYQYPPQAPRSETFRLTADGQEVFVYRTNVADFAAFSTAGPAEILVEVLPNTPPTTDLTAAAVRPVSRGIASTVAGRQVRFALPGPANLCLDIPGLKPLLVYANPPEAPAPSTRPVLHFAAGQVHDVGVLNLQPDQAVHIAGGAVVRGCLRASDQRGVRITGFGVLDGSPFQRPQAKHAIFLDHCHDVLIDGPILIEPSTWMLVLGCCTHAVVRNLKEIGQVISSDGIDICGSTDVLIDNCIIKNNDDCIVLKSLLPQPGQPATRQGDVARIHVRNCTFLNDQAGNAMEIGFETCTDTIQDVLFENCDVLHVHGHGAPFSIHAGDHATIQNIRWENIRVEHYFDKLLDFRVVNSRWGRETTKGRIRNVTLRNIHITQSIHNVGYSTAIIGGLDDTHDIDGVTFDNFLLAGKKAQTPTDLDLYLRHAKNVRIL